MRRLPLITIPILILGLASAPAQAEPIEITAGTLTVNRTFGVFHLQGPRDFLLDGFYEGSPLSGVVVGPGDPVSLFMLGGVAGNVSIDGQTFPVHPVSGPPFASVNVLGSVVAPSFSDDQTVSVFAPFSFTGRITPTITSAGPLFPPLDLVGQGTVEVEFRKNPFLPIWEPQTGVFRYESSEQAPIPEPATLILVGTGIAAHLIHRRRRRGQSDHNQLPNRIIGDAIDD
jgi:hypothetical protein